MTYKIAQTVGKKTAAQHRKPNATLNQGCTGPTATFPICQH